MCHFIHGCADAAIALHGEIDWRDIVSIKAQLPEPTLHIIAEPAEAKENATTEYEAKFSAQHVVAACLIRGGFNLPDLLPEALADERVRDLAKRVKCSPDPWTRFPDLLLGRGRSDAAATAACCTAMCRSTAARASGRWTRRR